MGEAGFEPATFGSEGRRPIQAGLLAPKWLLILFILEGNYDVNIVLMIGCI